MMKPSQEKYDQIQPLKDQGHINIPGIYCAGCGETYARYSYSFHQADAVDENGKPYYNKCFKCSPPKQA